jgi:penicillin G amidase
MDRQRGRIGRALLLAATLGAVALWLSSGAQAAALRAEAVLPPGNSGHVSIPGVLSGEGSPHLYDQVKLYNDFRLRPFGFRQDGEATSLAPGVKITRDAFGVPSIDAASDRGAWWGAGWAAAEDRLFQLELFRRAGSGRLAEILGSDFLDDDLVARRDYYTVGELDRMLDALPRHLIGRMRSYRDGINAYIAHLRTNPLEIPGEMVALGVPLTDWTVHDSARIGILLARTVPSGDGNELANAQALAAIGAKSFNLLHPVRTPGAIPTIKRSEGRFPAQPGRTRRDEKIGFRKSRRWLRTIDLDAREPGTTAADGGPSGIRVEDGERPGQDLARILPGGGSFMWAISDRRRSRAYLFNGPQLGFSVPELFWEVEVHSPTQDVRGVTAAGVPLIGIGHNGRVAWGFTSGLSDEDDLFAVELVGPESYIFRGRTTPMSCRNETFSWKPPPTALPGLLDDPGLPAGSRTERICRTRHGPVQFRGDGVAFARRYAIWERELETAVGLSELNDARNIGDVDRAMRRVSWNENVMAVDSRGRIGFWHPGLHPLRPKRWDERLPFPGDGRAEWRGLLPRKRTPHVVNPSRGWLVNWNNVPSRGWTNGDGPARERLSGNLHRVRLIRDLTREVARRPSYRRSREIELTSGTTAQQFPYANRRKLRRALRRHTSGSARGALRQLLRWDGDYHRTDGAGTVDPGVAIWEELKAELQEILLRRHGGEAARPLAGTTGSSHEFDITNGEAIALRTLRLRAYGRAADAAARTLSERFEGRAPVAWREPRRMYRWEAMGAGDPPPIPFFDRGTWSQSLAMGRRP